MFIAVYQYEIGPSPSKSQLADRSVSVPMTLC